MQKRLAVALEIVPSAHPRLLIASGSGLMRSSPLPNWIEHRTVKPSTLSALILLSASLTPSSGQAIQIPLSVDLSFTVYSEFLEPVSGARVKVDGAAGPVQNADAEGHTATIQSTVGAQYDVHLKESNVDPLEPQLSLRPGHPDARCRESWLARAVIALDCSNFGFTQEPVVDLCFVATSTQSFGATTLSIDDTYWTGGVLRLSVSGGLGIGTTLLLVRPDGGSANDLHEVVAQAPTFGPATAPNGSGASLQAQRCTPPTPAGGC